MSADTPTLQQQYVLRDLEQSPLWSAKIGPAYNPVASTVYGTKLLAGSAREFFHEAPPMGGFLSGLNNLPLPPNWVRGTVIHRARILFDGSIVDGEARIACEFDNRIADGRGNNFNFSNQINIAEGWMWQVDNQTGRWTNSVKIPALAPLEWHSIAFESAIDMEALTLAFKSLVIDGVPYTAPASLSNLTAMKDPAGHPWARGANLQVQMCRQTAGFSELYLRSIGITFIPE